VVEAVVKAVDVA
jgi:hypothetical protein